MQALLSPETATATREELILAHLPSVTIIARTMHRRLPSSTSLDDLISTGTLGLIEAIDNFKPEVGVQLKTYAAHRIRGAILDSLRRADWAHRGDRRRAKLIKTTIVQLEHRNQAPPEEAEVARELGIGVAEYREWQLRVHGLQLLSLDVNLRQSGRNLLEEMGDSETTWPCCIAERAEMQGSIERAIQKMSAMEQTIMTMYFKEEVPLREIAKIVNRHESRVSQLKTRAILRLRSHLANRWPMGEAS